MRIMVERWEEATHGAGMVGGRHNRAESLVNARLAAKNWVGSCRWVSRIDSKSSVLACSARGASCW